MRVYRPFPLKNLCGTYSESGGLKTTQSGEHRQRAWLPTTMIIRVRDVCVLDLQVQEHWHLWIQMRILPGSERSTFRHSLRRYLDEAWSGKEHRKHLYTVDVFVLIVYFIIILDVQKTFQDKRESSYALHSDFVSVKNLYNVDIFLKMKKQCFWIVVN